MIARSQSFLASKSAPKRYQAAAVSKIQKSDSLVANSPSGETIRLLFWIYIVLLLAEGILRKWIVPSLSNYLLFARDPVVIAIYLVAVSYGIFPVRGPCAVLYPIAILSTLIGLIVNSSFPLVTLVGIKSNFLHIPLLYIIPLAFTRQHVIAVGKILIIVAILMVPLVVLQYRSAPDSIWNVGAGGARNGQLSGALGKIRPPGIFSFITGVASFCAIICSFIIFGFIEKKIYNRFFLIIATVALILTVALSISRTTLAAVTTVLIMNLVIVAVNSKLAGRVSGFLIIFGIILFFVSSFDLFKEGQAGMSARLENTGDLDRGVVGTSVDWSTRIFGDLMGGINAAGYAPFFGSGIGLGTNAGSALVTGAVTYLLAEGDWARDVLEMGPFMGLIYIGIRVAIVVSAWLVSIRSVKEGNSLPLLLFGASVWNLFNGQFGQSTALGFAILGGALCFSAQNIQITENSLDSTLVGLRKVPVRSRSRYAEFLHGKILPPSE